MTFTSEESEISGKKCIGFYNRTSFKISRQWSLWFLGSVEVPRKSNLRNQFIDSQKIFWNLIFYFKLKENTKGRGVARYFLEGGSKSSKVSATMFDRWRGFWDAERLKRYISGFFQWNFAYSSLSFPATVLFYIP